jgi:hypothetical protein
MNALAAWQNALIFCDQLSQRTQLWPENVKTYKFIQSKLKVQKHLIFVLYILCT